MSGKRKNNAMVQVQNPDGSRSMLSQGAFGLAQSLTSGNQTQDISSLDKQEFAGRITDAVTGSHTNYTGPKGGFFGLGTPVESSMQDLTNIQSEMADAVAGTKPKYRYRKYLDQISMMQQDQPGQAQTVLSLGGSGLPLGG